MHVWDPDAAQIQVPNEDEEAALSSDEHQSSAVSANEHSDFGMLSDEVAWQKLTEAERGGMDFPMLENSRSRYKCIGAMPINTLDQGLLGCISYNIGVSSSATVIDLQTPQIERVLDRCVEMASILFER